MMGQPANYATEQAEKIFRHLILKERRCAAHSAALLTRLGLGATCPLPILCGALRRSLLSWMLHVCEHEHCQDEVFPLASMILDKFITLHPSLLRPKKVQIVSYDHHNHQQHHLYQGDAIASSAPHDWRAVEAATVLAEADATRMTSAMYERELELERRQLVQFAACSLMLATKLRQTPRLSIRTLIEFSAFDLQLELTPEDLTLGERFMLDVLKWDIAGVVTPNEFLQELLELKKCRRVLAGCLNEPPPTPPTPPHFGQAKLKRKQEQHQHQQERRRRRLRLVTDVSRDDTDELPAMLVDCLPTPPQEPQQSLRAPPAQHQRRHLGQHQEQQPQQQQQQQHHHHQHHRARASHSSASKNPKGDNSQRQAKHHHQSSHSAGKCKLERVKWHTQNLLELCMLDDQLSQHSPSTLAMASMAVAIYGLCTNDATPPPLDNIVEQLHESTDRVNKLELMIDVAHQIEGYFQEEAKKANLFGKQ